jgi:hypothetical protein
MTQPSNLDTFTAAYIECALWSTMDESDDKGGEPLDKNYTVDDIDDSTLAEMAEDCRRFQEENYVDLLANPPEEGGYDFWLTRNGHGCGFWDSDWQPQELADRLTKAAKKFGEYSLYVTDDSKISA